MIKSSSKVSKTSPLKGLRLRSALNHGVNYSRDGSQSVPYNTVAAAVRRLLHVQHTRRLSVCWSSGCACACAVRIMMTELYTHGGWIVQGRGG